MVYRSTAYSLLNLMMFGARALDTLCRDQGVCYCRADGTEENGREGGCNCPSRIWQISMMQNLFNHMLVSRPPQICRPYAFSVLVIISDIVKIAQALFFT